MGKRFSFTFMLLVVSFLIALAGVVLCLVSPWVFMHSAADWLTFDYTIVGWAVRVFAFTLGLFSLLIALLGRPKDRKLVARRRLFRTDMILAITAMTYEVAGAAVLLAAVVMLIDPGTPSWLSFGAVSDTLGWDFDFADSDD